MEDEEIPGRWVQNCWKYGPRAVAITRNIRLASQDDKGRADEVENVKGKRIGSDQQLESWWNTNRLTWATTSRNSNGKYQTTTRRNEGAFRKGKQPKAPFATETGSPSLTRRRIDFRLGWRKTSTNRQTAVLARHLYEKKRLNWIWRSLKTLKQLGLSRASNHVARI